MTLWLAPNASIPRVSAAAARAALKALEARDFATDEEARRLAQNAYNAQVIGSPDLAWCQRHEVEAIANGEPLRLADQWPAWPAGRQG